MFQKALIEAVEQAHTLKSHAGDRNKPESSKAWLMCYNMYGQTQWGATLLNLLGHNLAKTQQPLAILELGSGDHKTFKNLTTGIVNRKILYHSVDRKPSSGALIPRRPRCVPRVKGYDRCDQVLGPVEQKVAQQGYSSDRASNRTRSSSTRCF